MTSTQPMQSCTRSQRSMRRCIGWPPRSLVMWSLSEKSFSTKFDEANQTIGALRFENNFLVEKTKKLEAKLFQVKAQLERTSSAKLNEILSLQKSASDRTGLRYDFSSPNIASTSYTVLFLLLLMLKLRTIMSKLM